jgi:superoxide dismutase, Cu-Zn family
LISGLHRLTAATLLGLLGCAGHSGPATGPHPHALFPVIDSSGTRIGQVSATEDAGGVVLDISLSGLTPGRHGLHLHATPSCEPPGFLSAGGHFNPTGRRHGAHNPQGAHAGDLPNLDVNEKGEGRAQVTVPGYTLSPGPRSVGRPGTALVVHAKEDDEATDPTGNSGARIACAVIILP